METATNTSTAWKSDASHSEIGFKVKHLMITNVRGTIGNFEVNATSKTPDDFEHVHVEFSADAAAVDTGNEQRDQHLKSADFFDSENHPKISFVSNGMVRKGDNEFEMTGDLTIRGVTRPIKLQVELTGIAKDPWGQTKAGFTVEGKINRKDYGLVWNAPVETGGVLVSEEVKIHCEIQMIRQA